MVAGHEQAVRAAAFADLDGATLYALLKLRHDVFVVEQNCVYPELDGRDTEPATRHLWIEGDTGNPLAYLRVLDDVDALRIGRVVTAPQARGSGLAAVLVRRAVADAGGRPVVLEAQTYLVNWYERLGFTRCGDDYIEDGISHTPMRWVSGSAGRPGGWDGG
jgi:ElaA protein